MPEFPLISKLSPQMIISKLDAAFSQTNQAIRLLFDDDDPISAHTLSCSGANILTDLANHKSGASWRQKIMKDNQMSQSEINSLMNRAWNFFKHADSDPEEKLEFEGKDTEHIIFFATLDAGTLGTLSSEMMVFQSWYIAATPSLFPLNDSTFDAARKLFPDLDSLRRVKQLKLGKEALIVKSQKT